MRDLPDSASLDHLRRQAKDQPAVLRRTKPGATLTDAQASVAQQYGFGSWTELKTEVERRNAARRSPLTSGSPSGSPSPSGWAPCPDR